jgi:hypothetical protein
LLSWRVEVRRRAKTSCAISRIFACDAGVNLDHAAFVTMTAPMPWLIGVSLIDVTCVCHCSTTHA